jgi:hypothetical protein
MGVAYVLEGRDTAGLGRNVVDKDTALRLGAESVVELEAAGGQYSQYEKIRVLLWARSTYAAPPWGTRL